MNKQFIEEIQMANKPKNWSTEPLIKEIWIKTMKYHFLLFMWKTLKNTDLFLQHHVADGTIN